MTEQEKVHDWNRRHPIGTTVDVSLDGGGIHVSTTRCEARLLSGKTAVIWVRGLAGAYPLDRVRARVEGEPPAPTPTVTRPASAALRFDVLLEPSAPDAWRVEAIDRNGTEQFYLAIFRGPDAEARAREYAAWKNARGR